MIILIQSLHSKHSSLKKVLIHNKNRANISDFFPLLEYDLETTLNDIKSDFFTNTETRMRFMLENYVQ